MSKNIAKKTVFIPVSKSLNTEEDDFENFSGEFEGWASTVDLDSDNEIIDPEAFRDSLAQYMKFPTIREMHEPKTIGKALSVEIISGKGLWLKGKIVDSEAKRKLFEELYPAMSVGIKVLEKIGNIITKCQIFEVSLVDIPANEEALIEMKKMQKEKENNEVEVIKSEDSIDLVKSISEFLESNNISIEDFANVFKAKDNKEEENKPEDEKPSEEVVEEEDKKEKSVDEDNKEEKSTEENDKKEEENKEKSNSEEVVLKSLWNVSDFINCINGVVWAMEDKEWEANYQNDEEGKALAEKLRVLVEEMGSIAGELLQSEISKKTDNEEVLKFSKKMDLFKSAKLKVDERKNKEEDKLKAFNDTINDKDSEIKSLKETIDTLKSKITVDTRDELKTIEKTIKDSEENTSLKKYEKEEKEIKEKMEKSDDKEKERLKRELSIIEFKKSMFN